MHAGTAKEERIKLSAPNKITWFLSLILGILSLVAYFVTIPFITVYLYWFLAAGWLLLILSSLLKGF